MKYLITGGSGFIGTNLIAKLSENVNNVILNLDIQSPKILSHEKYWKNTDICNINSLKSEILNFQPDYVIHLAARTDLRGKLLSDYDANIVGVKNLLESLNGAKNIKRVIFTSSMYVCRPGYKPKNFLDFKPHTIYGESKVITEKYILEYNPDNYIWTIIRPTSIWGPWFGEPYLDFFKIVLSKKYLHMGKKACKKTYGYIDNTIYQIENLLSVPDEKVNKKNFYIGDWPEYDITEWANEIAHYSKIRIPYIPFFLFKVLAYFGDLLKLFGFKFPMTSFRLKNMTTNNVLDVTPIKEIAPNIPVSRNNGVKKTLDWILSQNNIIK